MTRKEQRGKSQRRFDTEREEVRCPVSREKLTCVSRSPKRLSPGAKSLLSALNTVCADGFRAGGEETQQAAAQED